MTKTKNIALALLLAGMLAAGTAGAALAVQTGSASALDTGSTVTYPFEKGVDAFQYAPSFTMATEKGAGGNKWEYIEVKFDSATVNLQSAEYFAVQIRVDAGSPGLTLGFIENADRFNTSVDGNKFYFMKEDGTITEMSVLYSALNFSAGMTGTLLMPKASLGWQWNNSNSDLSKVTAFYYTTNTEFNFGYKLTIGEVGYYTADPATGAAMTKLVNLSGGERAKDKYYVDSANPSCMKMPSEQDIPDPEPLVFDYPFRTGKDKEYYTATWTGFTPGDSADNFQEVKVQFDNATVDFSGADYLLLQVKMAGGPGVQYILNEGTRSNAPKNDKAFYFYPDNGTQATFAGRVANAHITFSNANMGALVIPIGTLDGNADLTKIDSVSFKTNSRYNGDFSLTIGEIGMYKGSTFTKLLDLSEAKNGKFTVSTSQAGSQNKGRLDFNEGEPPITQLGDASVDFNANKHLASDFAVWDGGGSGTVTMTKDSYGLDAVQITPSGVSAGKDSYMATTLSGGGGFSWANMKGVSFWARNDSDTEIHFNVEVDCKKNNISDRFNVEGGHRYYLYDVRTQKTTIYMTRATATMGPICLPVGFEGWIRVPFSAYHKADWSNNGFVPSEFMKEGTIVSYLAITVQAEEFSGKAFAVNMFGAYATTPSYSSVFVQSQNTIDKLMELDELELQDPVGAAASEIALYKIEKIVSKEEN